MVSQEIDGMSLAAAQMTAFDTTFRHAVASAMNVDPGNVVVVSITAGTASGSTTAATTTTATTTTLAATTTPPSTSTTTATNIHRKNGQIRQQLLLGPIHGEPMIISPIVTLNNSVNDKYLDNGMVPWVNYDRIGDAEVYDNQHDVSWIDYIVSNQKSSQERSLQSSSSSGGGSSISSSSTSNSISITYNVLIVTASAAAGISLLGTSILSGAFSAFLQTGGYPTATCTVIPSTYSNFPSSSPVSTGDPLCYYSYDFSSINYYYHP